MQSYGIKSWLLTKDHKRIALLYLFTVTLFFFLGGAFATMIRVELLTPTGNFVSNDTYNKLFTMHGVAMIFFFLIPSIPATLGNFFLPMMIGARDLAFPRINLLSWYLLVIGGLFALFAMLAGGVDTGWTFYTPYSTTYSNTWVIATALGIFVAGFSSILTGLNFIVTVHRMRAPGMTWFAHAAVRLGALRHRADPGARHARAGRHHRAAVLRARLPHRHLRPRAGRRPGAVPAPLLVLLAPRRLHHDSAGHGRDQRTGLGVLAQAGFRLPSSWRSPAWPSRSSVSWFGAITCSSPPSRSMPAWSSRSSATSSPSLRPSRSLTGPRPYIKARSPSPRPMLYAFGFIGLFTIGGLTGLFVAALGIDVHVTDTYFVVAHFHYIMVGGAIMGYLGGLHYWWPKMTGRMYPEGWAKLSALVIFLGFNLTFFPQFILGYLGMPRRYHVYPDEFQVLHVLSTAGASVLAVGYLMPMIYFIWSLKYGAMAPAQSLGRYGPGVEDAIAAAACTISTKSRSSRTKPTITAPWSGRRFKLASDAHVHARSRRNARAARAVRYRRAAEGRLHSRDVDLPHHRSHVLRRPVPGLHGVPSPLSRGLRCRQQQHRMFYRGAANTVVLLCSSLTMVLAVRAAQLGQKKAIVHLSDSDPDSGRSIPGCEGEGMARQVRGASHPRPVFPSRRYCGQ